MRADRNAPAFATYEIEINAPPEVVWEVLTDLRGWPSWNPNVQTVDVDGPVSQGTVFKWRSGGSKIKSTVREVERPNRIAWTGSVITIKAVHVWSLTPQRGRTLVATEESFGGLVARLFRRSLQKMLDESLSTMSKGLKTEAEKRSGKRK